MKLNKKIGILSLASALCLTMGAVCVNEVASASTANPDATMVMASGAAVNKTTDYGGIRWTTTVGQGFAVNNATNLSFGTFVIPTATYENASAGTEIKDMSGVMNLQYNEGTAMDTANFEETTGFTYYSAIQYDDIVADYKKAYPTTQKTDAEIATEAYKLELTAISYATDGTNYVYATATDVSRSARQVANMAILDGELDEEGVETSVKTKVEGYVGTSVTGTTSAGYLDLTEIKDGTAQSITSNMSGLNENWANVEEIVVGAKRVKKTVDTDTNVITVSEIPEKVTTYENGEFAYICAFTADGVYNVPVIAANGVISTWADVVDKLGNETGKSQSGYYVLTQNIVAEAIDTYTTNIVRASVAGEDATVGLLNATLDGQGYTISGFMTTYGLFGYIRNSTIKNLGVDGGINKGQTGASLLAITSYSSTLDNVYVKASSFGDADGYSTIAYRMTDITLRNCLIDSTAPTEKHHYLPYYAGYHRNAPASISQGNSYSDVSYENTYVLSGLPLVYKATTGSVKASCTDTSVTGTKTHYHPFGSKGNSDAFIYDTLAETDIIDDKSQALTGTDLTSHTGASYQITVRSAEVDGMTTLSQIASGKTYSVAINTANYKVTKPIYYTGYTTSKCPHYRYYYYSDYHQVTGVKRYENASLMKEEATNNATELATYNNNYWNVDTVNGTLTWKNA